MQMKGGKPEARGRAGARSRSLRGEADAADAQNTEKKPGAFAEGKQAAKKDIRILR